MWYKKDLPDNLSRREKEKLKAYVGHPYSDMNLVGQYENAVDILINHIVENGDRIDLIAHPLLYLMRHSIELALKENIRYLNKYSNLGLKGIKTHSINDLFVVFEKHYEKIAIKLNFKTELEERYNKYSNDFNILIQKLGDDWSSFRYIYSTSGEKVFSNTEIINLYDLKGLHDKARTFLTHIADAISPYTDFADYIKNDPSIKQDSLGYVKFCLASFQKDSLIEKLNEMYKEEEKNKIWFDENENCYLHLRLAQKKCYVIPMKKK
jgi:hypothetical protein